MKGPQFLIKIPNSFIIMYIQEKLDEIVKSIKSGEVRTVKQCIDKKAMAVTRLNSHGATSLHLAVLYEKQEVVQYLVSSFPGITQCRDHVSIKYIIIREDNSVCTWVSHDNNRSFNLSSGLDTSFLTCYDKSRFNHNFTNFPRTKIFTVKIAFKIESNGKNLNIISNITV